ncbi:NrtA/SsuA/CpmA family ABC transporter substrate-binding protein [Rhodoferax sp. GW822-FHT02A01]|uniref:ABC transporter substrate-binding protein n=1 Tax=Rhodoferax sp. GW822-FHT02A01 TaxID=3141537 RepID=UPI00315DE7DF
MLVIAGYLWNFRNSTIPAPMESLTLATNTVYAGSCPIFVAQENGYFTQQGLQVNILPFTNGKDALAATLQGKAQLGVSADIPVVFSVMRGQPVSIVATIFSTTKDYGIVGRLDRNVTTPASLRGKRIGATLGTSGHFVLDAFLNRQKMSASDVTLVDLKPEELGAALIKGDVDAVSTWEPFVDVIKQQAGANGANFSTDGVYNATYNLSGTREYTVDHKETIKKVLRALISGAQFCQNMPELAQRITAKVMKIEATSLRPLWPSYHFDISLDQSLLLALEDESRWVIKNKLVAPSGMPNYLNNVDLDGMLAVQPGSVTVIH